MNISIYTTEECEKIAENADLRYVKEGHHGILRHKCGKGFRYLNAKGESIKDGPTLKRIKALAIPPAYKDVWICPYANGHIQATGLDDKNRKQYIYHPLWHESRQQQKFGSLIEFGQCLPVIRKHIKKQLNKPLNLNKEQVICAIIYLLDTACIRIGGLRYAKTNHSFGATTLRKKHLSLNKKEAILHFPGKNAQLWHLVLKDKRIIKLLKKSEEIPGYELFKYYNEDGGLNIISSQDVNGYLQAITSRPFTAKNFRTWIACREFLFRTLKNQNGPSVEKNLIKEVAQILGHTPSICRKNYIDPDLIVCWKKGLLETWKNSQKNLKNKDKLLLSWLELHKM